MRKGTSRSGRSTFEWLTISVHDRLPVSHPFSEAPRARRRPLLGRLHAWRCNFIHNYGSGTHLDTPPEKATNKHAARGGTLQAEVVTDASGAVVAITITRSSGSNSVDGYVADSIRTGWPGGPSMRSVVELTFKPGGGFSNPKILSETPVP